MKKREYKYLRHKYMSRKGYFGYSFKSFTIDHYEFKGFMQSDDPFGNFAMIIPTQAYKPYIYVKPYRTLSEKRYFLPLKYI